jgi:DNA-binding SARP family transcriptional activator/WD40 repeat protein
MRFLVLGPLEVLGEGGDPVAIAGPKERTILAYLIARSGSVVSIDDLIDELWGDDPPRTAEKTIGSYVSRLRRVLDPKVGGGRSVIMSRGDGYELAAGGQDVDAGLFEVQAREGRERLAADDAEGAAQTLTAAIGLWRGDAYQGLRYTRFGDTEGERLDELKRSAAEDLAQARLAMGSGSELIAELEGAVREAPLRERRWGQLMLALYRSGRQAEALDAYRRARSVLSDELGIEPGPDLQALHAAILRQDRSLAAPSETAFAIVHMCPYKGLARFETSDAGFYFGREQTVARAIARLVDGRFLALVGASGSGKSSLLRAGVLHALEAGALPASERWSYALMRPGTHPLVAFRGAIDSGVPRGPLRSIVAIDQFEEVFTVCTDEVERTAFFDGLADVVHSDDSARVIVAMRADFYGRCAEYRAFAELLETGQILVGPMDGNELRRAIELPAHRADLDIEHGLTEVLVHATAGQPGGLPLLSTTMLELWTQRRDRTLTLEAYQRFGGVEGAVARLAEDAYGHLDEDQQGAAKRIFLRLAAEGDSSAVAGRQASLDEFDLDRDGAAARALAALTEARMLTVSDSVIEVAHEALFHEWPRLHGWLDDNAQGRSLHRHITGAARNWDEGARDDADLYRGARLTSALEWADEHPKEPNELERLFLDRSRSASEGDAARARRTNRRLRALLAGVAILLVVALVVGNVAIGQRNEAAAQGLTADARQLATRSLGEEDDALAILMARQAVSLHDSPDTRSALLAALEREPAAIDMLYPEGTTPGDATVWLRLSRDGRLLASGGARHQVTLFDTAALQDRWTIDVGHATNAGDFDPDGRMLTLATDDQHLINVDVESHQITDDVRTEGGLETLRYAPDGSELITAETDRHDHGSLVAREPGTLKAVSSVEASETKISGFAFSADGRRLVTTSLGICKPPYDSDMGTTVVWRTRDFSKVASGAVSGSDVVVAEGGHAAFLSGAQGCKSLVGGHLVRIDVGTGDWKGSEQAIEGDESGNGLRGVVLGPHRSIVTGGDDGNLTVWNGTSLSRVEAFSGPAGIPMRSPQLSPDGSTAYSVDIDGTIVVWDLEGSRRLIAPFQAGSANSNWPWFAVSPDGRRLAIPEIPERQDAQGYGSVRILDASTREGELTIPGSRFPSGTFPEAMAFSPDGASLAISGVDYVQLWNVETGNPDGDPFDVPDPRPLPGIYELWSSTFSPDGSFIAEAGVRKWHPHGGFRARGVVFVFDTATHELVRRFGEVPYTIEWARFTPDGRRLIGVTGEGPGHVIEWNIADGALISDTRVDDSGVYAEDISNDGRFLATGGQDSTSVKLLEATTAAQIGSYSGPTGWLATVDISPMGDELAGAGDQVILWDLASGTMLGTAFKGVPRDAAYFSPDGSTLYVLGTTGQAWAWDADPASWQTRACQVAGRSLTPQEWAAILPDRSYEPACS